MIAAIVVNMNASATFAAGRPITPNDLLVLQRITEPQLSPDGKQVIYTVGVPDLTAMSAARLTRSAWGARSAIP